MSNFDEEYAQFQKNYKNNRGKSKYENSKDNSVKTQKFKSITVSLDNNMRRNVKNNSNETELTWQKGSKLSNIQSRLSMPVEQSPEPRIQKGICTEIVSDKSLYIEYIQWDFINNTLYNLGENLLRIQEKSKQEFTNTLQRWFIFINEHFNEVPKHEYFPILPAINAEHAAAQFLRDAFREKQFVGNGAAKKVVSQLLRAIQTHHDQVEPFNDNMAGLSVLYDRGQHRMQVGTDFTSPSVPRAELLVAKAGLAATAKMLLRYESFGNGSYQWGDPKEVHKVLYEKFHVRYEGFASPVNSRFIEYNDTYFCSLFPETDASFGSLGNFFHVDMNQHSGGWSVNPPFLNDLMKKVADRMIEILDGGYTCYFFCTFPCWTDDEGWQTLHKCRHLYKQFDLKPSHFIVQDAYGRKLRPRMEMTMFVLGQLPVNCKLTDLGNTLIIDHIQSLPDQCPW